jgi:hypothetical protein
LGDRARGIERPAPREPARAHGVAPMTSATCCARTCHRPRGRTDLFPLATTVVVNRRGSSTRCRALRPVIHRGHQHAIDRLHTRAAARPRVDRRRWSTASCVAAGAHRARSLYVDTAEGCASAATNLQRRINCSRRSRSARRPPRQLRGLARSKGAVSACSRAPRFTLYPSHDRSVAIERGHVAAEASAMATSTPAGAACSEEK